MFLLKSSAYAQFENTIELWNGKVRIYYFDNLHQENAIWAKEATEKAWPIYKKSFNLEPQHLTVYIGNIFFLDQEEQILQEVYGLTRYIQEDYYIDISNSEEKLTKSTMAHELFHCRQFAQKLKPYPENRWFWEATAVWAESWVYLEYNSEHEYLEDIFSSLDRYFLYTFRERE